MQDVITLGAAESHHCGEVLRLGAGAKVTVFDGRCAEATCVVRGADAGGVTLTVLDRSKTSPPPCAITLAQAVPKGKNMELIVQKAVELGVARIAPLVSERTVVRLDAEDAERKREKWSQTALEACKQCGQNRLPEVLTPQPPKEFFENGYDADLPLVASLQPGARGIKSVLADYAGQHGAPPPSVVIFIGPEGDFTPAEIALIRSHGAQPVTLGPIILRTETAALYSLSVLAHELFAPEIRE